MDDIDQTIKRIFDEPDPVQMAVFRATLIQILETCEARYAIGGSRHV